jgi:hypothetical protein
LAGCWCVKTRNCCQDQKHTPTQAETFMLGGKPKKITTTTTPQLDLLQVPKILDASQLRNANPCKRLWLHDHVCVSRKNSLASAGSRRRRGAWGRPVDRDERTRAAAVRWRRTVRPILVTTTEEFRIRACRRACWCMNYGILMLLLVCRNDSSNCSSKKQADQDLQNQLKSPHDYYRKQSWEGITTVPSQKQLLQNRSSHNAGIQLQISLNCARRK